MKIQITLDLSKYSIEQVLSLYKENIITQKEAVLELNSRGIKDYVAILQVRAAAPDKVHGKGDLAS